MSIKEFGENAEINVQLIVKVNDISVWDSEYVALDYIFDDYRKIENELASEIKYQYEQLAEGDN